MRAIWNGAIGFGLVNIPVKLYPASESGSLDFDMLDKNDLQHIKYKRVNETTGKEVPWDNIVKGYKLKDKYIVLNPEDFEAVRPEKSKILHINQFVKVQSIDEALFETPYFLEPQKHGEAPYELLLKALIKSKMGGLGTFILREREILCLIRPYENNILMLNRMRYPSEIKDYKDLKIPKSNPKPAELKMAETLISTLIKPFSASSYTDTYHTDLLKLIKQKAKGKSRVTVNQETQNYSKAIDLMAVLKASLENNNKQTG